MNEAKKELGINEIKKVRKESYSYNRRTYNLRGQQVTNPRHGIYIQNGKKYIAK